MFVVDYGMARRKRPRRRYWWAAMGFAVGLWLGLSAAHWFASFHPQAAAAAGQGSPGAFAAEAEAGHGDGS